MASVTQTDTLESAVTQVVKERLGPLEEILAKLAEPAQKAGTTPEKLLADMTDGGRNAWGARGGDGGFEVLTLNQRRSRGAGMGEFWQCLAATSGYTKFHPDEAARLRKKFLDPIVQGGYEAGHTKAALAESTGVTGGYTVKPQFGENLLKLAIEDSIVMPRATQIALTGLTWAAPYLDQVTAPGAGTTSFLGGVQARWTSEMAARSETEPTFRMCELKSWELSFYTVASNNLLADNAYGLDGLLTQLFSQAIAWYTDYAFLQGDGVGKPSGVINDPATIAISRGTPARVRFVDIATILSRLLMQSWDTAVWVAHQSIIPDLMQMHDSSGNQTNFGAGRSLFVSIDQGAVMKPTWQLWGIPLLFTEKVPRLGTRGDLGLYDFSKYLVGRRMEIEVAMSPHVLFLNNASAWRVVCRIDGRPWLSGPVTLADGTHTVSPFVTIAT